MADIPDRPEYSSQLFRQGLEVRKEVLGADYVTQKLESRLFLRGVPADHHRGAGGAVGTGRGWRGATAA